MGKNSGFLAIQSCIAARNTQACFIPEFSFDLYGEKGLLQFIEKRIEQKKSSLIVLTEGCHQSLRDYHLKVIGAEWDGVPIK
jgi:6-phosphofructokinase 1